MEALKARFSTGAGPGFRRLLLVSGLFGLFVGTAIPYEALYLSRTFSVGPATTGALLSVAGILTLPLQIGSGHLSDAWGRKRLMQGAIFSAAAGCITLCLAPSVVVAVIGLILISCAIALYLPVAQAMAGDLAAPARREREFAWLFAAFGPGFAIGPLIGGIGASRSYALVFGMAGLAAVAAAAATLLLRETVTEASHTPRESSSLNAWQDPRVVLLGLLTFLIWLVLCQLVFTGPLWVVRDLGYPNTVYALMVSLNGALIFSGQALLTSRVMRFNSPRVLAAGSLIVGLAYGLMVFRSIPTLILASGLVTVGQMLIVPTTNALLDRMAPPGRRGQYQGAGAFVQSVGFTIGPLPGGVLLQAGGGMLLWLTCLVWGAAAAAGYALLSTRRDLRQTQGGNR
jgi:MFS family permease